MTTCREEASPAMRRSSRKEAQPAVRRSSHTAARRLCGAMLLAGTLGWATACNDEREGSGPLLPTYPTMPCRQIGLAETVLEDGQSITLTHTYSYEAGRVSGYRFLQSYCLQGVEEPFLIEDNATVAYAQGEATVEDGHGNTWRYQLDGKGVATECTYREKAGNTRTYLFTYAACADGRQRLSCLEEYIGGDALPHASVRLSYGEEGGVHVTQQIEGQGQAFTAVPPANGEGKNPAGLPWLFLTELYPLSRHHIALYGKLLGEPPEYLPAQIVPDGNEESGESITYTYHLDEAGIPTSCRQLIVSYGQRYERSITYTVETLK